MIAKLILKQNKYLCSNCYMQQFKIKESCIFCNAVFSNFEEILIDINKAKLQENKY